MPITGSMLTDWSFAMGETEACLEHARTVTLPHTFSLEDGRPSQGKGWYRTEIPAGYLKKGERAFLYVRGACRDARVYAGKDFLGSHTGSGYTPFLTELTDHLCKGEKTEITLSVENTFSRSALPFEKSFDWADDGGLFRPAELWKTGPAAVREVQLRAVPLLEKYGSRQDRSPAELSFTVEMDRDTDVCVEWTLTEEESGRVTAEGRAEGRGCIQAGARRLTADLWHFDDPRLYTLKLKVYADGMLTDVWEKAIGFRELRLNGGAWYLNGEPVRLPGLEWMPGSFPSCGMAEDRETLEKMLQKLRDTNTVLTRFHWQQDDWVYDWCDRHGLLVQEEVPFWGKQPEGNPEKLWPVAEMQIREMIRWHGHHPSIIAWGVGNELSGQTGPVKVYVQRAAALIHTLDPDRLANYVTNTAFMYPAEDATGDGDVMMINDYIGTWHKGFEQGPAWEALFEAHPSRAFVPSEFGLCEPAFAGGDPERIRIFLEKTAFYRDCPQIVGTICFCLNDYRTHMGEEGEGRFRRRVHGSLDTEGREKPSFRVIRREYAPIRVEKTQEGLRLEAMSSIPSYTLRGYILTDGVRRVEIPEMKPGESTLVKGTWEKAGIERKNGDTVLAWPEDGPCGET